MRFIPGFIPGLCFAALPSYCNGVWFPAFFGAVQPAHSPRARQAVTWWPRSVRRLWHAWCWPGCLGRSPWCLVAHGLPCALAARLVVAWWPRSARLWCWCMPGAGLGCWCCGRSPGAWVGCTGTTPTDTPPPLGMPGALALVTGCPRSGTPPPLGHAANAGVCDLVQVGTPSPLGHSRRWPGGPVLSELVPLRQALALEVLARVKTHAPRARLHTW